MCDALRFRFDAAPMKDDCVPMEVQLEEHVAGVLGAFEGFASQGAHIIERVWGPAPSRSICQHA